MRIIGGSARGRRLRAPAGRALRPTPERVREALFDILAAEIPGCRFLDLYAGTGAVGIEALSRGAARAVFVERAPAHLRILRENLERCRPGGEARILRGRVPGALDELARDGERFSVLFADPPYGAGGERTVALERLGRGGLLDPDAVVVVEHGAREELAGCHPLHVVRVVTYGDTALTFLRDPGPDRRMR